MTRLTQQSLIRSVIAVVSALAFVVGVGVGGSASAGGWAVASLDQVPSPTAGETTDVGFTILQHGETPAELTDDVGIEVIAADGTSTYFPATAAGPIGHYVATVTFPATSGTYAWTLHMGWFGPQELGSIDVAAAPAPAVVVVPSAPAADESAWSTVRWVMLALAVMLAVVAVADVVSTRRRDRVALG